MRAPILIRQEADEEHPDEVAILAFEAEFAHAFKSFDPSTVCPHCIAKARLMYMVGVSALDAAYEKLSQIKDETLREKASEWIQAQVDEATEEVIVEKRVSVASQSFHLHCEPSGNN